MNLSLALRAGAVGLASLLCVPAADAALHARLAGAAAYDDVLDVTWLTDAGLSGNKNWHQQLAWVNGLNNAAHLGFNDWRLASMSVAAGVPVGATTQVMDCAVVWSPLCRDNELGYMFYYNLDGDAVGDLTGTRTIGEVTLTNIGPVYWSATEYASGSAWITHFSSGFSVWSFKSGNRYAWAVRSGDVGDLQVVDSDGDGIVDSADNCTAIANPDQRDSDGDGFGNLCDADLNNDGIVNAQDLGLLRLVFFSADADADFNGDGVVNVVDLGILRRLFFAPPG